MFMIRLTPPRPDQKPGLAIGAIDMLVHASFETCQLHTMNEIGGRTYRIFAQRRRRASHLPRRYQSKGRFQRGDLILPFGLENFSSSSSSNSDVPSGPASISLRFSARSRSKYFWCPESTSGIRVLVPGSRIPHPVTLRWQVACT